MNTITSRYLIPINIAAYEADGEYYADPLWAKDIDEHVKYIPNLTIACPVIHGVPEGMVKISGAKIAPLPFARGRLAGLVHLPRTVWRLAQYVRAAQVVHNGIGGWPYPLGWIAVPLSRLSGKRTIIIVESAPWRQRSRFLHESLGRFCVGLSELAFFTQEEYRNSLGGGRGYIIHASWVDEDVILSDAEAQQSWDMKDALPRFLYVGRLEQSKGLLVLLEAAKLAGVEIDVLGSGPLKDWLEGQSGVTLLRYHAVVVPSLSDEQPRIVYDAYSQAIAVIASATPGLRSCVKAGWLAPPGDSAALSRLLKSLESQPSELRSAGLKAVSLARALTHQEMHRQRAQVITSIGIH
jgi:glycosyltransferase involved in cell wall biosynthesis